MAAMVSKRMAGNIGLALIIGAVLSGAHILGIAQFADERFTDRLFLQKDSPKNIVVVAIDDKSLQSVGRWPWSRAVHANLLQKIAQAGPRAIGYDVNFAEPDMQNPGDDRALVQAAEKMTVPLVVPVEFVMTKKGKEVLGSSPLLPMEALRSHVELGHTNMVPDEDGIVRRWYNVLPTVEQGDVPSFAEALAMENGVYGAGRSHPRIAFIGAPGSFTRVSATDVLKNGVAASVFAGKYVLIGATAPDLHDEFLTPTSRGTPMPGVEIHASALQTLLAGPVLTDLPLAAVVGLIMLFAVLTAAAVTRGKLRYGVLALLVCLAALFGFALIGMEAGLIVPVLYPALAAIVTFIATVAMRYFYESKERQKTRDAFAKYVAPSVIQHLLQNPERLKLGGEKRTMTVLFSDLRGFTTMSEGLRPEDLVTILNHYLDVMTEKVFQTEGVVDKYMGDAIMAFWGAPLTQEDHAKRAARTALAMVKTLKEMNQTKSWPMGVTLNLGIGLNTGPMIVGNMGSHKRFDYTVLGDSVNLGSRLEGTNKEYGTEIIASASTKAAAGDEFLYRPLDLVAVKGKKEPVEIFEVLAETKEATAEQRKLAQDFAEAMAEYRSQRFAQATERFQGILKEHPEDGPAQLYQERCQEMLENPPGKDWNGVYIFTKK